MTTLSFYINGTWCKPLTSTQQMPVINPATETEFASVYLANRDDVDAALSVAADAFESWSETSLADRITLVEGVLSIYERRYADIA